jgi:hypothetical protein
LARALTACEAPIGLILSTRIVFSPAIFNTIFPFAILWRPLVNLLSKAALRMAGMVLGAELGSTTRPGERPSDLAILSHEPGLVDTDVPATARSRSPEEFPIGRLARAVTTARKGAFGAGTSALRMRNHQHCGSTR